MSHKTGRPLIAHVIFRLDVGGLENGLVNLVNRISEERYRQVIICLDDFTSFRDRIHSPEIQVFALHKKLGKDPAMYFRMWRMLRKLRPDIIHTRNLGTVDIVFPAMLAGVRHRIHGEHGWDMIDLHGRNKKYLLVRRFCQPFIEKYIAVSRDLSKWLVTHVHASSDKVVSICNGVDSERFAPRSGDAGGRRWVPFSGNGCLVIGTIGRAVDVKDQLTLIRAFAKLMEDAPEQRDRLRLAIVGDGPRLQALRDAADELAVGDFVWLPGQQDDVDEILRELDIFVLPSLNEGISNTILEAMATGLPVIATDVGGNPELVDPEDTGFLVPVSDVDALARRILAYAKDGELRQRHGSKARAKVEREFSLTAMVDKYLAVYDEMLAGG